MSRSCSVMLFVLIFALTACGEDPEYENNSNLGSNNVDDSGDDPDDADDNGSDADAGDEDADGSTDDDGDSGMITDLCDGVIDLGELSDGSDPQESGDTAEGTTLLDPSCGAETNSEVAFEFQVDEDLQIDAQVTSEEIDDWVVTVYEGDCDGPDELSCSDDSSETFIAEEGKTYVMAVEPAEVGLEGPFELELETSAIQCTEVGATRCDSRGRVARCETGYDETAYNCAYECENGACGGDICETALEVDTSSSQTFEGTFEGYTNEFNFEEREGCGHTGTGPNTPGEDLVFSLADLSEDDEVTVDASNGDGQYGFFVLEECDPDAECVEGGLDTQDTLEWTVPADGDYYIVVDTIDPADDPQTYGFDIRIE